MPDNDTTVPSPTRPDCTSPSLTVVATSRNDDHGGNLLPRTQLFVDGLAEQSRACQFPVELLLVEWNPPEGRPGLSDALVWPSHPWFRARVVTVPPAIHSTFPGADRLPLFQMIAKNVGIRRAAGAWILATNIDIVLADSLFRQMTGVLQPRTLYRADRLDVSVDFSRPVSASDVRRLTPIRVHRRSGTYSPTGQRIIATYGGVIDWLLHKLQHPTARVARPHRGSDGHHGSQSDSTGIDGRPPLSARYVVERLKALHGSLQLHTNGCGDFTLLSTNDWNILRGYPEWPVFSWGLDTILLYHAYSHGLEFVDFPGTMPAFHIDHGGGWSPESHADLFSRLSLAGMRFIDDSELHRLEQEARRHGLPATFNDEAWGLAREDIVERTVS